MENCHTRIIISMWQNDLHTNTSRSVWPILYGLMKKMLQYKMYPAGELRCPTTALVVYFFLSSPLQLTVSFIFCLFLSFFSSTSSSTPFPLFSRRTQNDPKWLMCRSTRNKRRQDFLVIFRLYSASVEVFASDRLRGITSKYERITIPTGTQGQSRWTGQILC